MGVHPDLVDDVAQDVFLEVIRNFDRYDNERPFRPWLFGIARNLVYQEFRKHSRDRRLRDGLASEALAREALMEDANDDSVWIRNEHLKALKKCVAQMPDHTKRLIRLRFEGGYKSHEVASMVGMSAAAVRMALMRIRKVLRECMTQHLGEETA